MTKRFLFAGFACCSCLFYLALSFDQRRSARAMERGFIQTPVLKWQRGGCYSSWCETGWYSSPAVADLDGDGAPEVIGGTYSLFALNGEDGTVQWSADPEGSRVWPGVVVADLDGDRDPEVVTAHGGGYVHVFDHGGGSVWSRRPAENELRGLSVDDLDNDGTLEIIVTGAVYGKVNTWVLEHDGSTRPGWPQLSDDSGYAYGVFNDNAAVGDLDGDGAGEIVIPSDVHYICAYEADGSQIPAHPIYGGKGWGKVGVWESLDTELRGWGYCNGVRAESYRTNFAHGPAALADLDGDGSIEVVATGNVYDCSAGHPPGKYNGVYVFNADRSRFSAAGYDWRSPPVDTGAPLSEDYNIIESNQPNPAIADLDGDGEQEIVYSSYDGRVHAFWLDKTEHGNWPYSVYNPGEGFFRFASEPVVADLDRDGHAEVMFGSWVQKGTYRTGKLHILDYLGNPIHEVGLPAAFGSPDWNGSLAAPTLDNIDADPDLEVVIVTAHSGLVAYDLPGTAGARVLWGTGRGNYRRTAVVNLGSLERSWVRVDPAIAVPGATLNYTIHLENRGSPLSGVRLTDTLPTLLTYGGDLWASAGDYQAQGGVITWWGTVSNAAPVTVTFSAALSPGLDAATTIANVVWIDDGAGSVLSRTAVFVVNGTNLYLPILRRE
jgi:uncharacterized repeat protein (TIGR01451 family)